ncbi:MAG: DUF4296 domain-containing protein [Bacteroidales bacterium]
MIKHLPLNLAKAACIITVIMLLFNCHGFRNKDRIPEKDLVEFLTDLHMANAIVAERRSIDLSYKLDSASLYGALFGKYGFTKAQFDSSMLYYSNNPEKLKKLMNQVTARLEKMEEATIAEEEQLKKGEMDIIWSDSTDLKPKQGTMDKIEVDIPIKQAGMYMVNVTVRLFPDDLSVNPGMTLYFYRDDSTTNGRRIYFDELYYGTQGGEPITYTTTGMLTDSTYNRIRGSLANFANEDTLFNRNIIISDFTVTRKKIGFKGSATLQ